MSDATELDPTPQATPEGTATEQAQPEQEGGAISDLTGADDAPEPEAEQPADPGAPEKYDIKLPEGVQLDEEMFAKFEALAREFGLSNEKAQKLADLYTERLTAARAAEQAAFDAEVQRMLTTAKNDPEYGGQKFTESVRIADRALKRYGSADLQEFLKVTKLGLHPEIIRLGYRFGMATKEGNTDTKATPVVKQFDPRTVYPASNMNP